MSFFQQFGGKVTPALRREYARSGQWRDGIFHNDEPVDLALKASKMPRMLYKSLFNTAGQKPPAPLPVLPLDKEAFLAPSAVPKFVWYGHSVLLLRLNGKTVLIDPMFGPDCSPPAPVKTARFSENTLALINDLPPIDLVLLSHDHYDHLDLASIKKLLGRVGKWYVGLGVGRHLTTWGVPAADITEFDWWEKQPFSDLGITYTPTRHFSGRGLTDRYKSLWGGWVIETGKEKIWFSGDGGYGAHFKKIGEHFGGFDFAFMESGQYNDDWHDVHLFPDESVRAATDAGVRRAMPVHWAGFPLSYQHTWSQPAEEFVQAARAADLDFVLPKLGEVFGMDAELREFWWE